MLDHYCTSTGPIQHAGDGPVHCTSTDPMLDHYCLSTGPMLNHYYPSIGSIQHASTEPVHCTSIGPMLNHYYPSTGPVQHASTGPVHCTSIGPMLDHYYPSTGPVQHAGTAWASTLHQYWPNAEPLLPQHWACTACQYCMGQYIVPVLAQCWTITGPALGQYNMPALARFTASVHRMYWASIGLPVLARYCHFSWGS